MKGSEEREVFQVSYDANRWELLRTLEVSGQDADLY
jgi:hypothetical protein